MNTNPLLIRLIGKRSWLSARLCFWLAFLLGLSGLVFSSLSFLNARTTEISYLPFMLLIVVGLTPLLVALFAAMLTSRDIGSQGYELLQATPLNNADIVRAYIYAILYRTRILLILMIAAMPAIAVGMLELSLKVELVFCTVTSSGPQFNPSYCQPPPMPETPLIWMAIAIGLWGCALLAASLGVALAFAWRNLALTVIVAPLLVLGLMAAGLWGLGQIWGRLYYPGLILWGAALLWMIAPFAIAIAITKIAERWVRRT